MTKIEITKMFFISTGRCGTTRIAQILAQNIPEGYTILHQTKLSRRANIVGNMAYAKLPCQTLSNAIFNKIIKDNLPPDNILISTDPLISMIIPDEIITNPSTAIIHIMRNSHEFAQSMYQFTRKKKTSLIAHNFIPFWQPHLSPLENLTSHDILEKYEFIHKQKNDFYRRKYQKNPNYTCITMQEIFTSPILEQLIKKFWKLDFTIPATDLIKKTNQSIP